MFSKLFSFLLFATTVLFFSNSGSFAQTQSQDWTYNAPGNEMCRVMCETQATIEFSNGTWHNWGMATVDVISVDTDPVPVDFFVNYTLVVYAGDQVSWKMLNTNVNAGEYFNDWVMLDDFNNPSKGYARATSSVCFTCSTDSGLMGGEAQSIVEQ